MQSLTEKTCISNTGSKTRPIRLALLLLLLCPCLIHAQESGDLWSYDFEELQEQVLIPGDFDFFRIDPLGRIYTVDRNGQIIQYDEKGSFKRRYNNPFLGRCANLDVSNPLRILAYYPDLAIVIWLDVTLSQSGKIDLQQQGFQRVRAAGLSEDGRLWIYDEPNFELFKVNERGETFRRSGALNQVLDLEIRPRHLVVRNKRIFLVDEFQGVLVFDEFGTYNYRFGDRPVEQLQLYLDKAIYYYEDDPQARIIDLNSLNEKEFLLPADKFRQIHFRTDGYLLLDDEGLKEYR
jgi:hypothetical protein